MELSYVNDMINQMVKDAIKNTLNRDYMIGQTSALRSIQSRMLQMIAIEALAHWCKLATYDKSNIAVRVTGTALEDLDTIIGNLTAERPAPPPVGVASADDDAIYVGKLVGLDNQVHFIRDDGVSLCGTANFAAHQHFAFVPNCQACLKEAKRIEEMRTPVDAWSVKDGYMPASPAPVAAVSDATNEFGGISFTGNMDDEEYAAYRSAVAAEQEDEPAPQPAADATAQRVRLSDAQRKAMATFDFEAGIVVDFDYANNPWPDSDIKAGMFIKLNGMGLLEKVNETPEIIRAFGGKVFRRFYYRANAAGRAALRR